METSYTASEDQKEESSRLQIETLNHLKKYLLNFGENLTDLEKVKILTTLTYK